MARTSKLVPSGKWWKHLRWLKRLLSKRERAAYKVEIRKTRQD